MRGQEVAVISAIPAAQFHTLMNIVKSYQPPPLSFLGLGGSQRFLSEPSACCFCPAFTDRQHILSRFSAELIRHLLTANTANSQMSASQSGCNSPAVSLLPAAQIPSVVTLSCSIDHPCVLLIPTADRSVNLQQALMGVNWELQSP